MPSPRIWCAPSKRDAIDTAAILRRRKPTYGFLVRKPDYCRSWRIAIHDTYTGQFTGWVVA